MKHLIFSVLFISQVSLACSNSLHFKYQLTKNDLSEIYKEVDRLNLKPFFDVEEIHAASDDSTEAPSLKGAKFILAPFSPQPKLTEQWVLQCWSKNQQAWSCEKHKNQFISPTLDSDETIELISDYEVDINEAFKAVEYVLKQKPLSWDDEFSALEAKKGKGYTAVFGVGAKRYLHLDVTYEESEALFFVDWDNDIYNWTFLNWCGRDLNQFHLLYKKSST